MIIRVIVSLLLFLIVTDAKSDGFAVHAGFNYARVDTVPLGGHNFLFDTPPTLRDSFSGPSVRVGVSYDLSDWSSIEVGAAKFATIDKYNAHFVEFVCAGICEGTEGSIIDNVEQSGYGQWVAFAASRRYDTLRLIGKIGISHTLIESVQVSDRSNRLKERETSLFLGVGVHYPISERVALRLDLDRLGASATQAGISLAFAF